MNTTKFTVLDHIFLPTKLPRVPPWNHTTLLIPPSSHGCRFPRTLGLWLVVYVSSAGIRQRIEAARENGKLPDDAANPASPRGNKPPLLKFGSCYSVRASALEVRKRTLQSLPGTHINTAFFVFLMAGRRRDSLLCFMARN